jgi:hypothetical protein
LLPKLRQTAADLRGNGSLTARAVAQMSAGCYIVAKIMQTLLFA